MREELLDILRRLVAVRQSLGKECFRLACHRARLSIAAVVMEYAEYSAHEPTRGQSNRQVRRNEDSIKHDGTK